MRCLEVYADGQVFLSSTQVRLVTNHDAGLLRTEWAPGTLADLEEMVTLFPEFQEFTLGQTGR